MLLSACLKRACRLRLGVLPAMSCTSCSSVSPVNFSSCGGKVCSGTQWGRQDLPDGLCTYDGGRILTPKKKLYPMTCPYILAVHAPAEAQ
jgi:hypothetical protein